MVVSLLFILFFSFAQEGESLYLEGIKAFQNQEFEKAHEIFTKVVAETPSNPPALYNLGLVEYKKNKKGLAVAAWRKAISIDSSFKPAKEALTFAETELPGIRPQTNKRGLFGFVEEVAHRSHLHWFLGGALVSLLIAGFYVFSFLGKRKSAFEEELPMPPVPMAGLVALIFTLIFIYLGSLSLADGWIKRATVVAESIELKAGPSIDDPALFEVLEGFEVHVLNQQSNWAQIKVPGGLSGWVPLESIVKTGAKAQ